MDLTVSSRHSNPHGPRCGRAFANASVPSSEMSEWGDPPSVAVAALMGDATVQTVAVSCTYPDRALWNGKRAVYSFLSSR